MEELTFAKPILLIILVIVRVLRLNQIYTMLVATLHGVLNSSEYFLCHA